MTGKKPPSSWPPNGEIQFDCMSLCYTKQDDPVLKNITCSIKAKEKVYISPIFFRIFWIHLSKYYLFFVYNAFINRKLIKFLNRLVLWVELELENRPSSQHFSDLPSQKVVWLSTESIRKVSVFTSFARRSRSFHKILYYFLEPWGRIWILSAIIRKKSFGLFWKQLSFFSNASYFYQFKSNNIFSNIVDWNEKKLMAWVYR